MNSIDGVEVLSLNEHADARGSVRHVWRGSAGVEEVYFSTVLPGVIKAWHVHKRMTLRYAVAYGHVLVGLVDGRETSATRGNRMVVRLEDSGPRYLLVVIPPGVANGFRAAPEWPAKAVIVNVSDMLHDPEEIVRMHPRNVYHDFPWGDYALAG